MLLKRLEKVGRKLKRNYNFEGMSEFVTQTYLFRTTKVDTFICTRMYAFRSSRPIPISVHRCTRCTSRPVSIFVHRCTPCIALHPENRCQPTAPNKTAGCCRRSDAPRLLARRRNSPHLRGTANNRTRPVPSRAAIIWRRRIVSVSKDYKQSPYTASN